jgi:hypothetical protein
VFLLDILKQAIVQAEIPFRVIYKRSIEGYIKLVMFQSNSIFAYRKWEICWHYKVGNDGRIWKECPDCLVHGDLGFRSVKFCVSKVESRVRSPAVFRIY